MCHFSNEKATSERPGDFYRNMWLLTAKRSSNSLTSCFLEDRIRASSRGRDLEYREANDAPQHLSYPPAHGEWGRGKEGAGGVLGRAAEGRAAERPETRAAKNI